MKNKQLLYILAIPVAAVLVVLCAVLFRQLGNDGKPLDFLRFKDDWRSMEGNSYTVRARVDGRAAHLTGVGGVLVVQNLEGAGRIPLFIPESLSRDQNFENGQRFKFRVNVRDSILHVESASAF